MAMYNFKADYILATPVNWGTKKKKFRLKVSNNNKIKQVDVRDSNFKFNCRLCRFMLDTASFFTQSIRNIWDSKKATENWLKKIMEVDLTPKKGHFLQLPNQMKDDHFILEGHAHLQIHRLEEALNENKFRQTKRYCSTLRQMWALPTDDEIMNQINHENMITLKMIKKTDRQILKLYNCNLLLAENVKSCYRILRSCHNLRKVELQYCQIDDRTMGILLKALIKLPDLLYLGLKGNNLTMATVSRLDEFLQEKKHFPSLLWITMDVNNAVNTFPKTLVHALVSRWPRWIRKNLPSDDVKLSSLDILQGHMPRPFINDSPK